MCTMEEILEQIEADRRAKADEADAERTVLAAAMMAAGVTKASIEFSGYGDSGNYEEPEFEMAPGHEQPADLSQTFLKWVDTYVEGTGVDWYNNDGGFGEIEFDLTTTPPQFRASISQNETVSNEVWSEEDGA